MWLLRLLCNAAAGTMSMWTLGAGRDRPEEEEEGAMDVAQQLPDTEPQLQTQYSLPAATARGKQTCAMIRK